MADPETTEEGGRMFGHELGAIIRDTSGWKAKRSKDILQLVDNGSGGCGEQRPQDSETRATKLLGPVFTDVAKVFPVVAVWYLI